MRRTGMALVVGLIVIAAGILLASLRVNPYLYFAGYVILQYVVIATAWNILGGYAGYVNFGTPAFFALGAYTAVFLVQTVRPPLPVLILAGGLVSALLGLGIGIAAAGLAGALLIMIVPVVPSSDRDYIGRMFAITVLGGMGSIGGTLVAAIILGVVESLMGTFFGPSWSLAVSFGILLIALAVRPAGLFGR